VDALLLAAEQRSDSGITKTKAEDIVYVIINCSCF
jgi:hypothetical protein